jgi:hypothetical protein
MAPWCRSPARAAGWPNDDAATTIATTMTPRQRAHRPLELGPRLFRRGRWWAADLRYLGGARVTLRNPKAQGWPDRGERTTERDVAERWRWAYVDRLEDTAHRRQLGRRARSTSIVESVDNFLTHRELTVEPLTARNDETALRIHFLPAVASRASLDDVDDEALQRLFDRLARAGYAPSTLVRYLCTFGALFRFAGRSDSENPAHHVVVPAIIEHDARAFSEEELAQLREAANPIERDGW